MLDDSSIPGYKTGLCCSSASPLKASGINELSYWFAHVWTIFFRPIQFLNTLAKMIPRVFTWPSCFNDFCQPLIFCTLKGINISVIRFIFLPQHFSRDVSLLPNMNHPRWTVNVSFLIISGPLAETVATCKSVLLPTLIEIKNWNNFYLATRVAKWSKNTII